MPIAQVHCGEAHGEVVTRLRTVETLASDTERELRDHERNGGTGHVGRVEFDELRADVRALKALGLKLIIGVLIAASGGSALSPHLVKLLGG